MTPYSITITPDNIVVGCQCKSRSEWLKVTEEGAKTMGLAKEHYEKYKSIIKMSNKLVKLRKKKK